MTKEQLKVLEKLPQYADGEELTIAKNDPKNGNQDYWWCSYGKIHLTGYYSLPSLLADLADECVRKGYAEDKPDARRRDLSAPEVISG